MFLTAVAAAAIAVGAQAQTQVTLAPAGQAYTIISNADATAVNPVTYQWYRDNSPIVGATKASYTVLGEHAYGDNVQFYRLAKTLACAGDMEKPSNTITITFTGYVVPAGCNLVIGGVCWADCNIDNLQTFAARADMYTKFYQWNKLTAYSAENPLSPAWDATVNESTTWTVNPCPQDWRLPTLNEYQQLLSGGSTWVEANTRGNAVNGRFFGYNQTTCQLPSNMSGCVFFPTSGFRSNTDGELTNQTSAGYGWSSAQYGSTQGYRMRFTTSESVVSNTPKGYGLPIRCVR